MRLHFLAMVFFWAKSTELLDPSPPPAMVVAVPSAAVSISFYSSLGTSYSLMSFLPDATNPALSAVSKVFIEVSVIAALTFTLPSTFALFSAISFPFSICCAITFPMMSTIPPGAASYF